MYTDGPLNGTRFTTSFIKFLMTHIHEKCLVVKTRSDVLVSHHGNNDNKIPISSPVSV